VTADLWGLEVEHRPNRHLTSRKDASHTASNLGFDFARRLGETCRACMLPENQKMAQCSGWELLELAAKAPRHSFFHGSCTNKLGRKIMNISDFANGSTRSLAALALCCLGTVALAQAETYPNQNVRSIVGFPPGGTVDFNARLIGNELSELWDVQVVIENIGGSGSALGAAAAAAAEPDGYTYLVVSPAHTINASLRNNLPFDTLNDFTAVTRLAASPLGLYLNPSVPIESVGELVDYARENPGELNFGYSGVGASTHLSLLMFTQYADIEITGVPYQGGGPLQTAILSGEVDGCFCGIDVMKHVPDGNLKVIAVTTPERSPTYPDLPTVGETVDGYAVETWYGVYVPAGTPDGIVQKLYSDINEILQHDNVRAAYENIGFRVIGSTPEELAAFTEQEIETWRKIIEAEGISVE